MRTGCTQVDDNPVISIIGIGGAGVNTINSTIDSGLQGVRFIAVNTDRDGLESSKAQIKILTGESLTKGFGANGDTQIGRQAALENAEEIRGALEGSDMAFIAAGLGGGTGTGASPVVAEICKEMGMLTVAVVTKPFSFEGKKRMALAQEGVDALTRVADMVVTVQNDRLRNSVPKRARMCDMFRKFDQILAKLVRSASDVLLGDTV